EADLSRERAAKGELERAVSKLERAIDDVRNELVSERGLTKSLRQELDHLDNQTRGLKDEQSEASSVREELQAEIERARGALAESQRAHTETQKQLAAERNSVAELRRGSDRADEQLSALSRRESEARNSHEHITKVYDETVAELQHERDAYAELRLAYKK